ncbi:hypothetical protein NCC49_001718 [Naganishia albida]|nr:hypothetical protein NCC49_001718 [Naganishia albida]
MANNNTGKSTDTQANGLSDFEARMEVISTKSHVSGMSTRSEMGPEDGFMMEVADDERGDSNNIAEGSVSRSRATSITSSLTERLTDLEERPTKRARSNRSVATEELDASRASSPLSVEMEPPNGRTNSRKRVNHATSRRTRKDTSSTPPRDSTTISVQPPSTPAGPSLETASALQELNERAANQRAHSPQEPYVASPHNVFRPPPSAALAIFDRPPSPSFYEALQSAGQPAKISTGLQVSTASPNPFSSPNGSTGPKIKLSLSSLKAAASPSAPQSLVADADSALPPRHPRTSISVPQQTHSLVSTDTSPYAIGRIQKGKGKAKINSASAPEAVQNNDYCAACLGIGSFLCCDGCPRSFHFICLDPPLTKDELPDEDKWYCKACRAARRPKTYRSPYTGLFAELLQLMDDCNPKVFKLPEDIRTYFAGVQTLPDGSFGSAVDARPVKFDRAGFPEGRDSYKLKTKGNVVLCYKCKGSAAPVGPGTAQGLSIGRNIVTCDYCPLSWHLDCLDPPAANMPNSQRKWMCPNHAAQVLPKKRLLKHGVEVVNVTQPGQPNNGLVEIIDEEAERRRIAYEHMFINGKRYKVPERIIHLDFWTKLGIKGGSSAVPSSQGSAAISVKTEHQDSHPNEAENYTVESLFGGQSPLSSAPSSHLPSPHQAVLKLPTIEEDPQNVSMDPTVDAAQILLSLSHNGPTADCADRPADDPSRQVNGIQEVQLAAPNPDDPMSTGTLPSTPTLSTTNGHATPASASARKIRLRVSTPIASSLQSVPAAHGVDGSERPHPHADSRDSPIAGSTNWSNQDNDSSASSQAKLSQQDDGDDGSMAEGAVPKQKPGRSTRPTRRSNPR